MMRRLMTVAHEIRVVNGDRHEKKASSDECDCRVQKRAQRGA